MPTPTLPTATPTYAAVTVPPDLNNLPRSALLDDKLTAAALDTTPGTLCTWRSTGRHNLPYVKVGRRVKYRVGDLLDWLEQRTRCHTGESGK